MTSTPSTLRLISPRARPSRSRLCPRARMWKSKSLLISKGGGMRARKSWREKLADNKGFPKVGKVTGKMSNRWGEGTMVIPSPMEVDGLMKQVPKGKLATINELRTALAARHKADFACPITTGIFSWIAAYAAEEAAVEGVKRTTPYWRTLKSGGEINPKYP